MTDPLEIGPLEIGPRIRELRLAKPLSQSDLARAAGISPSYLNLIEHGRRRAGGKLLSRVAAALGCDRADLERGPDPAAVAALRAAGAGRMDDAALAQAPDLARRFPAWAAAVAAMDREADARRRAAAALADRYGNDPVLTDAAHELLDAVASVRSTASILAGTPGIDANWLRRFHASIDEESRRLAVGAQAMVGLLSAAEAGAETGATLPAQDVADLFDAHGHRFDAIEAEGADAVPALVADLPPAARPPAEAALAAYAADAARLPLDRVAEATDPDALLPAAGGDAALVLRRMAVADPRAALAVVDAAGAFLVRRAAPGFPLPRLGAGCPLWPLYAARPGAPAAALLETPDGGRWIAHAAAEADPPTGFAAPAPPRATMLVRPTGTTGPARPVGAACATCPRADCPARREPPLAGLAPLDRPAPGDHHAARRT